MSNIDKIVPFYYSLNGDTEEDEKLLRPFKYIFQCNTKHIYTKLTTVFNYWFKIPSNRLQQIDEIINIFYNVCILFDDIQDDSILREDFPVTQSIYGRCNTLNAANYVQYIAFEKIVNLHPIAHKIVIEELLEYNRGQGMDMYWKDNFICPTEKDYKIMAMKKSSWLVKLVVRLMKLFSTHEGDFSSLVNVMGLYYQIRNDYCNLCFNKGSNYCDDLSEGKINFPVIHALTNNPDDTQIINILRQRTRNIEIKRYCVKLLDNYGSFKYTRDTLKKLDETVRVEIERLGGNPLMVKILDEYKNEIKAYT